MMYRQYALAFDFIGGVGGRLVAQLVERLTAHPRRLGSNLSRHTKDIKNMYPCHNRVNTVD